MMRRIPYVMTTLLLIGSLLAVGCGGTQKAENDQTEDGLYSGKVILGSATWIGYAPLHLAVEKGFAKEEGVDLEMRTIESTSDIANAMRSESLQGTAETLDTEVIDKSAGLDLVAVQPLCNSNGADGVVVKKTYDSLESLKGKTIALETTGGASLFWFNTMLAEKGLSMKDFDVKSMSAGDAGSAFVGGQVDAAVTWEPWLSKANHTDFGKTLVTSKEYPGLIVDSLAFRRDFAEKYPKTVQGIIRAWFRAVQYIKDHPDEAIPICAESQGMTPDEFKEEMKNIQYFDEDMTKDYLVSGKMADIAQKMSDLWLKMKITQEPVEGKDIVDPAYYQALGK